MLINLLNSLEINKNYHYIKKYISFISSRRALYKGGHVHHILPKANDMFPQFKNLNENPWNGIRISCREHFIAHWMLAKAFPSSSQQRCFYHFTNKLNKIKSKDYEKARQVHIDNSKLVNKNSIRNEKISKSLKGKPKSKEHIQKLIGHIVTEETRLKLRQANLGKTKTEEERRLMSESRKGKTRQKNSIESIINIARSKCKKILITPIGTFQSFFEVGLAYNLHASRFRLLFSNVDVVPRKTVSKQLQLEYIKHKTYRDYGFSCKTKDSSISTYNV